MEKNYLESIHKQFEYYKLLGETTITRLSEEQLFWQYNEQSNSIAAMVKHISGNMLSRWTDFLTADGEKDWRNRDSEFVGDFKNKEDLIEKWEMGWSCLFEAIDSINEKNFDTIIYIRNMGHTVIEAINRQLAHYAYHIGQIVYLGRMILGESWESLSIPKGESTQFNQKRFAQPKRKEHFTEEFLDKKD